MGSNQNLKAYVRYDGSGRVVAGSLILRRQKPKVGKWGEINKSLCCGVDQAPVEVAIESSFPISYASIQVGPNDGNWYQPINSYSNDTAADVNELANVFNANFPNLGTFTVLSGTLFWSPSAAIADFYVGNKTTSLYAYAFSD
jgi:hypothetical protein